MKLVLYNEQLSPTLSEEKMSNTNNWHLFCRVVDNFGDIGVCWRLAQQLVQQHKKRVTLWVDDLQSFNSICPEVNTQQKAQVIQGVAVRHWQNPFAGAELLAQEIGSASVRASV